MRVTTGWSLLVDREVMHILAGAELLPRVWAANATATAFPIPEELPVSRQQLTVDAAASMAIVHACVMDACSYAQHAMGCMRMQQPLWFHLSQAVVCPASLGNAHSFRRFR